MAIAASNPERKLTVFEFQASSNARTRGIARTEERALEKVAEATQVPVDDFELVETYDPANAPDDAVFVTGHPFTDGDRIGYDPGPHGSDIEMTVKYPGKVLSFTDETSPTGIKTPADAEKMPDEQRTWEGRRAENMLCRLFKSGWRPVE